MHDVAAEVATSSHARPERGDLWDIDRMNHLHDLPRFCPDCGAAITERTGLAVEYWTADRRVYHLWCRTCGWAGDITRVRRMVGPDSPE